LRLRLLEIRREIGRRHLMLCNGKCEVGWLEVLKLGAYVLAELEVVRV